MHLLSGKSVLLVGPSASGDMQVGLCTIESVSLVTGRARVMTVRHPLRAALAGPGVRDRVHDVALSGPLPYPCDAARQAMWGLDFAAAEPLLRSAVDLAVYADFSSVGLRPTTQQGSRTRWRSSSRITSALRERPA